MGPELRSELPIIMPASIHCYVKIQSKLKNRIICLHISYKSKIAKTKTFHFHIGLRVRHTIFLSVHSKLDELMSCGKFFYKIQVPFCYKETWNFSDSMVFVCIEKREDH